MKYKIIKISGYNNPYTLTLKGETIERRNIESLLCGNIQATTLVRSDFTDAVYGPAILLKVKGGQFCGIEEGQAERIVNTLIVGDKL